MSKALEPITVDELEKEIRAGATNARERGLNGYGAAGLSVKAAAALVGRDVKEVRFACKSGQLRCRNRKAGGQREIHRILPRDLAEWEAARSAAHISGGSQGEGGRATAGKTARSRPAEQAGGDRAPRRVSG